MKQKILKPILIRKDKRGVFIELINRGVWRGIYFSQMEKGAILGSHYHLKTKVFFYLIAGRATIELINVKTKKRTFSELEKNQGIIIPKGFWHAIKFLKTSSFVMSKSESFRESDPDTYNLDFKSLPEPEKSSKIKTKS